MKTVNSLFSLVCMGLVFRSPCLAEMLPQVYGRDAFIVEEYPIARDALYDATRPYLQKREPWRTPAFNLREINQKLSSVGYRFVQACPECSVDFYHGTMLIIGGLENLRGFSMDHTGQHFVFFASQVGKRFPESELVCINGDIQRCTHEKRYGWGQLGPCYVNDELVWCEVTTTGYAQWEGVIRNATTMLYSFTFPYGAGAMPVHFEALDGQWLLQIDDGRVILDGADLCQKYGYSGMWKYRLLQGKPFFFFTRKGEEKIRLSYDGNALPHLWYDVVGDNGGWTILGNEVMVWFGAIRGDQVYYVEAGAYD